MRDLQGPGCFEQFRRDPLRVPGLRRQRNQARARPCRSPGASEAQGEGEGATVAMPVPVKVFGLVQEAARLNGRDATEWAIEALGNAARQQIGKHARRTGST